MQIALNLESFFGMYQRGGLEPTDVVRLASEIGADGIELSERIVDQEKESILLEALAHSGVQVPSCYVFCELLTPDPDERQRQIESVCCRFERVSRFGAPQAVVIPGSLPDETDADLARGWLIEALQSCLPIAAENGLTLAIENVGFQADVYARAVDLQSICMSVGSDFKLTFDAGNFLLISEDALDAFDLLASRVVHVHVKDWQPIDAAAPPMPIELTGANGIRYCPAVLGDGVVNLPGMIDRLDQSRYDGFISVEYEGPDDPFDSMRKGVEYLRALDIWPAKEE